MGLTWSLNDSYGFIGDLIFCCGRTDRRICNKGVPRGPKKYKYDLLDKGSRQKNGLFTVRLNVRGGSPRLTVKILFFFTTSLCLSKVSNHSAKTLLPIPSILCWMWNAKTTITSSSFFLPQFRISAGFASKVLLLRKCPIVAKITLFKRPKDFKNAH